MRKETSDFVSDAFDSLFRKVRYMVSLDANEERSKNEKNSAALLIINIVTAQAFYLYITVKTLGRQEIQFRLLYELNSEDS